MFFSSVKEKLATSQKQKSSAISSFKSLYPLILPLFCSLFIRRFLDPVNTAFAGRISTKVLSAVSISSGLLSVTATGFSSGLVITFQVLAARSYGKGDFHEVGIILQKTFIFACFLCILAAASWVHAGVVFTAIGIPADIPPLTEKYLLMFIPAMLSIFVYRLQRMYLILLGKVYPAVVVAIFGLVLLVAMNFLLINVFHMGEAGIAISNDTVNFLEILMMFVYLIITGIHKDTWPGFSKRCLLGWNSYLSLAVPAAFGFLLRAMVHEIALLSIGSLGVIPVAAQSLLFMVTKVLLQVSYSITLPVNLIISKCFGEGDPYNARITAVVGFFLTFIVSAICTVSLTVSKDMIGYIFTNDVEVIRLTSKVLPYTALSLFLESIATLFYVICSSFHLQPHSILVYWITSYTIGLPLGIALAVYFKDLTLLWCGLIAGFALQLFMFAGLFWWKVDFEEISKRTQKAKSSEYIPVETSDCSGPEEVETVKDSEKASEFVDKDMESKQLNSSPDEKKLAEDEQVTFGLICKRLLVFGSSIVILVISIILRFCY